MRPHPEAFLPLKPDVFEVLLTLADGELHGYGILKVLESRAITIAASLLYRKLRRLMEDGLVTESSVRPSQAEDARRRYYRLTPLGLSVVRAEATRIVELARNRHVRKLAEHEARHA
jgi:DNA-binding PadR family transcriptional regulator